MAQLPSRLGEAIPASIDSIVARQESEGAWGYGRGSSWVEPTAWCLLGLGLNSSYPEAVARGTAWLRDARLADGSWPALAGVDISAGAPAPAVIALLDYDPEAVSPESIEWLLSAGAQENSLPARLRRFLMVGDLEGDQGIDGWPWADGASAWVMPTAWSLAALKKFLKSDHPYLPSVKSRVAERIIAGERFLESRVCEDGGWNHGGNEALGYVAPAYPETTGAALIGLAGSTSHTLPDALNRTKLLLKDCRSQRAAAWLRIGLLSHGVAPDIETESYCRDVVDVALTLIAGCAESGRNPLLDS